MSIKHTSGLRRGARIGGVAAAAAIALGFLSAGAANADTFVPLPDGEIVAANGNAMIKRTAESALISPSLAANGAGRVAWVSGTIEVDVKGLPADLKAGPTNGGIATGDPTGTQGTNGTSTNEVPHLTTGYIIGCQMDITGLKGNLGAGFDMGPSSGGGSLSGSISVPISAGQVKFARIDGKDILKDGKYSYRYQDAQIEVQGCGGYAQARAYTVLEVTGANYSKTTLYGQPFSIG
ncbi:MspA family porin [Rhodococcus aetherivorans]|uniref:MspA family porin n=1 Tax=Rhodococcus aetherivorans TaxID=191292 RepID=A0AA46PII5_9NOCA|nr:MULTISPECIES: MspA family porin [Rhodococcus]QIX51756.1 mspA family protein [Rhodococcus sp. DMU1]UGQ42585.1 MspA family porin [Rhodococcus aetherivorans]USC14180.1 MspA family porin [Rhodococcus sp. 11-3]UYF95772.1 MspA family porin [Rhodococcus aetherivorans]